MSTTPIDEAKLEAFMGQAVTDMGAIISAPLMLIGEKLGLYKAMAGAGPLTAQEVAERSGAAERYVREWLGNQAAGGYVEYDPASDRYTLPDEHALALADEDRTWRWSTSPNCAARRKNTTKPPRCTRNLSPFPRARKSIRRWAIYGRLRPKPIKPNR